MDKVIVVIIGIPLAFVILYYKRKLYEWFGSIGWFEKYMGPGSTETFYIIVAILVFVLSISYAMGALQSLLSNTIGKFF